MTNNTVKPEVIEKLGENTFAYNYNINEVENGYNYETEIFDTLPTRSMIINRLVTNRYPLGEEQAILRKGIKDPLNVEYLDYYEFVESVKKLIDI